VSPAPLTAEPNATVRGGMGNDVLERIDAKLGAVLALILDGYLRQTGVAQPKPRSVDRLLADAGLNTATIARMLGKTERAVQLQLASTKKTTRKSA
jgi:hypothetical protein